MITATIAKTGAHRKAKNPFSLNPLEAPAKEAVSLGLIDRVCTFEDALQRAMGNRPKQPRSNGATKVTTSPVTFESAVKAEVASGKTLMQARLHVAKTQPALHQEYLQRVNSQPEQPTAPAEKPPYWQRLPNFERLARPEWKLCKKLTSSFQNFVKLLSFEFRPKHT